MPKNHRYWFLRFIEGTDGANAGGAAPGNAEGNGGAGQGSEPGKSTDWEARAKELEAERDKWKSHSRTWEDRAKENQSAASRLKELEDEGKPDAQKLEERLAQLQEREAELATMERKALVATIAAEEGVSKDDFEFFPDSNDEDILRKFAKRLAAGSGRGAESNNFGGSTGASKEAVINRVKNL